MLKRFKILMAIALTVPFLQLAPTFAAPFNPLDPACNTNQDTAVSASCKPAGKVNPISGPNGIISKVANIIALIGGIAAVIVIIISGFMFITAGGGLGGQRSSDPNRAKTARAALTGSVVGLIVIFLAWSIVRFVTDNVIK